MKIEEFKNIKIAYMRNVGEYGLNNIKLMNEFKDYLKKEKLYNDHTIILGIALDNPAFTHADNLRYDVGHIISEERTTTLNTRIIDDGRYAIFEVIHTTEEVQNFWQNIVQLTKDLPVDDSKPIIDRYAMSKIKNNLCEFCIPLK